MSLDLGFLAPKPDSGWYDLHLHNYRDMNPNQRRAHLHSMKGSQGREYGRKLRLVLTEQDDLTPGADPWKTTSYTVPDITLAMTLVDQIVIRHGGQEIIIAGPGSRLLSPTGRMARTEPNTQNVPLNTPEVARVKAAFRRRMEDL
jgi:hypothetical protein